MGSPRALRVGVLAVVAITVSVFQSQWLTAQQEDAPSGVATLSDGALPDPLDGDDGDLGLDEEGGLDDLDSLLDADLNQLAKTDVVVPMFSDEVTTVARQESTVGRSPAAVYVITGEMIRRSGARSIPDALRLAPGVNVARMDASKWAISIRGNNGRFANKLLVQIDGRTVYTPLFAGTFWDVQDVLLEDIARIEIIRGPGATVWGANAVNGVINIITKSAADTQGFFAEGGGGGERQFYSARIGGPVDSKGGWRVYGKWFERDRGYAPGTAADDWHMARSGFRTDWMVGECDALTFQGDYYDGDARSFRRLASPIPPFVDAGTGTDKIRGGNLLFRWTHTISDQSDWALQLYFDRTERSQDVGFHEHRNTVDLDFQHRFKPSDWHSVVWGFGYRNTADRINNAFHLRLQPTRRADDRFSIFAQNEFTLAEDELFLTAGSKFSWNDYTGFEMQPTGRLLYTPTKRKSIWASVSRAVRVPSRTSDDLTLISPPVAPGVFPVIFGNRGTQAEELIAYEIGMRAAPRDDFSWDLAGFYNQYDDLEELELGPPAFDPTLGLVAVPNIFRNTLYMDSYGFEFATTWQANDYWTLRSAYSFLRVVDPGTVDGQNPRNQAFLQSSWDLDCNLEFDLIGRYTDSLWALDVPAYFEMDARLSWRPTEDLEFALVGRNLLDSAHIETRGAVVSLSEVTQIQRELFGVVTWRR